MAVLARPDPPRPAPVSRVLPPGRHRGSWPGRRPLAAVVVGAVVAAGIGAIASGAERATLLVEDGFDRSVLSGWGSAALGGEYAATAPLTGLSVRGGSASAVMGERSGRSVWLRAVSARDVSVRADVVFPTAPAGFGQLASVTMRKVGREQEYRVRVRFAGDRSLRLSVSKIVGGRPDLQLAPETVVARSLPPGAPIALAAGVSGDTTPTLVASAWVAGSARPTAWQLRYVDGADPVRSAGAVGVWFYVGSGQVGGTRVDLSALSAVDQVPAAPAWGQLPSPAPTVPTLSPPPTLPTLSPLPPSSSATGTPSPTSSASPTSSSSPSPAPTPTGRPSKTAGAPPLGSTRYPVPTGARVVAPGGDDSAAGSSAAPFRTINRAVQAASSGDTIVLRAGVYHESVEVPWTKRLTLQNWPGEAVWLDGTTVVGSWTPDGSTWRHDGWTPRFDSSVPAASSPDFDMIDSRYPMASHPEQVWIDGQALRQVGSRAQVTAGTFFVDTATSRLYVGSSPVGRQVRATDLAEAIYLNRSTGSVVRGIGVRRYATPVKRMGMVKAYGDGEVLADLHVESSATTGISVRGTGVRVENNTVRDSGQLGIHGNESDQLVVRGNLVQNNNVERFAEIPVAGGIKIGRSRHITLSGNAILANASTGIWLDESVYDARLLSNDLRGNSRHGIYFELSARALIADNVAVDNGGSGIRVADSSQARIWNNTVLRNAIAVDVQDGPRVATNLSIPGHDPRQPLPDPTVTWVVQDIEVRNNILDVGSRVGTPYLFRADDGSNQRTAEQMRVTADHNVYVRPSPTQLGTLVAWSNRPAGVRYFGSVGAFRSGTGQEAHGLGFDAPTTAVLVGDSAAGDLRLRVDSPARGRGAPLPTDVAAALGRAAGVAVDPGAFFG